MISRKHFIEHACPTCNVEYGFLPDKAGHETTCNYCNTNFTVPVGLPQRMVDVSTDRGRTPTPEELDAFYNSPAGQAYLANQTPSGVTLARWTRQSPCVPNPYEPMPDAHCPVPRRDNGNKIKLWFLKWFGFETVVDRKTSNAMATTALGGVLVALGAVVMARMGMKPKA